MSLDQTPPPAPERPGLLFRLASGLTAAFVITVLCLIATVFADPRAPVNIWLNENATPILIFEVLGILIFGGSAMAYDQYRQASPAAQVASEDSRLTVDEAEVAPGTCDSSGQTASIQR